MPFETVDILTNEQISGPVYRMTVPWAAQGGECGPGQFFMIRAERAATLLPRAVSVCDWRDGTLVFLYQVVGRGTKELASMRPGDALSLTGPLGNGFPVERLSGNIALAAGGIGVAPMLLTARRLRERGCKADLLCGFRDEPWLADELDAAADELHIATETGRFGVKGYVTALLHPEEYDAVLCCGPEPMMKAVTELCKKTATPVYVSMENKMACGIGGCLVCTCTDKKGRNIRTCKDGPVFRGEEIDFDA